MHGSSRREAITQKRATKRTRKTNHDALLNTVQDEMTARNTRPVKRITIRPLTNAQRLYDAAIFSSLITFGVGPAGTGKTWLAAARAAEQLRDGHIERIIVTRPAIEAEENLGFLPGEAEEKYAPYFRPVRDALEEVLGRGALEYHIKSGAIEARPLAYLRGATFKDAVVILDEAQNTTVNQMKMFLTRIGDGTRVIVNGDPAQKDLPRGVKSGLADAVARLRHLSSVAIINFAVEDIVRSGICQDIVRAYEEPTEDDSARPDGENIHFLRRG